MLGERTASVNWSFGSTDDNDNADEFLRASELYVDGGVSNADKAPE
jgi:hypothetical protein